jgi:transposase
MAGKETGMDVEAAAAVTVPAEAGQAGRVAGLDIGKASLVCCVRVPDEARPGRRSQEVRTFAATTGSLLELRDWLICQGVTRVVMESTSVYWKPPFYLLEDAVAECWVVNAREVRNVPGRPKTDRLDAVWLAKLAEMGMVRPSFIPPPWQRELRDLCRYRRTLIQERVREKQRAEKLLEDAQIKLSSVITDIFGVSGRDMLDALAAGHRDPAALAALARGRMRGKDRALRDALTGRFTDHHGYLLAMMLARIDGLTAQVSQLTSRIDEAIAPFAHQVAQLLELPGVAAVTATEIIAEIGVDMTRFPGAGHLVSWAKFAPMARQSASRSKPGTTGKGNPWIAGTLGDAAMGAARTPTFLGARYHRIARRRGKQRAIVATGNAILTIAWHLLSDPDARFSDLGPGWHDKIAPIRRKRNLIAELERLTGKKVQLQDAA